MGKFLSVLMLCTITWCGSAFIFGLKIKQQYRNFLVVINHNTPFQVKLVKFKRGIFNSQATAEITLEPWLKNPKIKWQMHTTFVHGPIVLDQIKINFLRVLAETSLTCIGGDLELNPAVMGELRLSLGGRLKFKLKSQEKLHLLSTKKALTFQGEIKDQNLSLEWYLPKLLVERENKYLEIKEGNLDIIKNYSADDQVWLGTQTLDIEQVKLETEKSKLQLKGIFLNNHLQKKEDHLLFELNGRLKKIIYNDDGFDNNFFSVFVSTANKEVFNGKIRPLSLDQYSDVLEILEGLLSAPLDLKVTGSSDTYLGNALLEVEFKNVGTGNQLNLIHQLKKVDVGINLKLKRPLFLFLVKKFSDNFLALYQQWLNTGKILYDATTDAVQVLIKYTDQKLLIGGMPVSINF